MNCPRCQGTEFELLDPKFLEGLATMGPLPIKCKNCGVRCYAKWHCEFCGLDEVGLLILAPTPEGGDWTSPRAAICIGCAEKIVERAAGWAKEWRESCNSSQNMHNQDPKSLDPMTCDTEPKSTGLDASTGQSVEKQATGLGLQGGLSGDGR